MDKFQNDHSAQNELDLELNQEKLIAKKQSQTDNLILNKVINSFNQTKPEQPEVTETRTESNVHKKDNVVSNRKPNIKNIENWKILQKLPVKYRRPIIACIAILILLLALLWLKPNHESVKTTESNDNNMQIDFQPLAPQTAPDKPVESKNDSQQLDELIQNLSTAESDTKLEQTQEDTSLTASITDSTTEKINQENARLVEQAKLAAENVQIKQAEQTANTAVIEENKPADITENQTSNTKTLVIPAGTSLFQVFRNNGLSIQDVNAMTKAEGAKNLLSSFKANDRIRVSLNDEGRVILLILANGAAFTRQTDGSYKYHPSVAE